MLTKDTELDKVTEAFLTQRIYAPRVEISNDLKMAIRDEYIRLRETGIKDDKRITSAIEFVVQVIGDQMKNDRKWQKTLQKSKKPNKPDQTEIQQKLDKSNLTPQPTTVSPQKS